MEEEKMEQETKIKAESTVKQKLMLTLGVIGLIGFGFAIAIVSFNIVEAPEKVIDSKTIEFTASTEAELETKLVDAYSDLGIELTDAEAQSATGELIGFIEDGGGDEEVAWSDPRPDCKDCGLNRTGYCRWGICATGSGSPGDWEASLSVGFF